LARRVLAARWEIRLDEIRQSRSIRLEFIDCRVNGGRLTELFRVQPAKGRKARLHDA
jgi:hypothetical protein